MFAAITTQNSSRNLLLTAISFKYWLFFKNLCTNRIPQMVCYWSQGQPVPKWSILQIPFSEYCLDYKDFNQNAMPNKKTVGPVLRRARSFVILKKNVIAFGAYFRLDFRNLISLRCFSKLPYKSKCQMRWRKSSWVNRYNRWPPITTKPPPTADLTFEKSPEVL